MRPLNSARIIGSLFIFASAAPMITYFFSSSLRTPDYLVNAAGNETQILNGVLVELVWALAVVGIPTFLFPILKQHSEALALSFFSLRFIEALSTIIHSLLLLSLLTLGKEYVASGDPVDAFYYTMGDTMLAARDWAFKIGSGLVWSLSAIVLNYILYKANLVPSWLSGWGFVGASVSILVYMLQFFSITVSERFLFPIAAQEMVFAVWLIVKGFNPSAITLP